MHIDFKQIRDAKLWRNTLDLQEVPQVQGQQPGRAASQSCHQAAAGLLGGLRSSLPGARVGSASASRSHCWPAATCRVASRWRRSGRLSSSTSEAEAGRGIPAERVCSSRCSPLSEGTAETLQQHNSLKKHNSACWHCHARQPGCWHVLGVPTGAAGGEIEGPYTQGK